MSTSRSQLGSEICPKIRPWPQKLVHSFDKGHVKVALKGEVTKASLRELDSWSAAYVGYQRDNGKEVKSLQMVVERRVNNNSLPDFEAFRRRASYLKEINTDIQIEVRNENECVQLMSLKELFDRSSQNESVRSNLKKRGDDDSPGRLEKDFQAFLFGKGLNRDRRENDRCTLFGEDFYNMKDKNCGIIREFPTGVFRKTISRASRILPTEFVDLVTLNKREELSIIEIKIDEPELSVLSQLLDYALFFRCYWEQIRELLKDELRLKKNLSLPFICYVVNSHYHPLFDTASSLYTPNKKEHGFEMVKITLGHKDRFRRESE